MYSALQSEVMDKALQLARSINSNAPIAVQTGMQTLRSHKVKVAVKVKFKGSTLIYLEVVYLLL